MTPSTHPALDRLVMVRSTIGADMSDGSVWLVVGAWLDAGGRTVLRLSHREEGVRVGVCDDGDFRPGDRLALDLGDGTARMEVLGA